MFTILREIVFVVPLIIIFVYVFNLNLIGVWLGLAIGRGFTSILNYLFARHEIRKLKFQFKN